MTAAEIEALGAYYGATPRPDDFESFWRARMAEADAVPLHYTVTQAQEVPSWDSCEFLDLWFTGMEGARLYAKFLRPRRSEPMPLVLQFHGYPGASRSFAEQASFAGMGMALIAMDCPGQAGYSEDVGGFLGTTVSGHIIAGLDGPPERMYYVRLHQNIRILCRLVRELDGVTWINDSKGTNPDAAIQGIRAMNRPTLLIGGGYDKQSEYDEWIDAFDGKVKKLVLIGQTAEKIENCAHRHGFMDTVRCETFEEAINYCYDHAVSGDAVLLSPACASWGMFPNYEERGRIFKDIVRNLKE